jgi:hypothetical protein
MRSAFELIGTTSSCLAYLASLERLPWFDLEVLPLVLDQFALSLVSSDVVLQSHSASGLQRKLQWEFTFCVNDNLSSSYFGASQLLFGPFGI